jgi:hypothetical protein
LAKIFNLPEIEESFALLEDGWIPVSVKTIKPLTDSLETDPEDPLVFGKVIVTESLLHSWSPGFITVGPFPLPTGMSPWILD